ncbi:pentapeptide repeat-containing protein [Catellatospora sp. TT07R-123]|uniref:pentapeptide repeat-containing protein n=1 Tax=Catellatospora sp. TT07R-123 TaxID=2733863 RepID=UPI001BB41360|nr:pentapeptide repeat-containing protein [Catellatospora sp. TT07R-123]
MLPEPLSATEQAVVEGFRTGTVVDLSGSDDRDVRAEVLRGLLLAGPGGEPSRLSRLRLTGARIAGPLDLDHSQVDTSIALHDCVFTDRISCYGTILRHVDLKGCRFPGLLASYAVFAGTLNLRDSHSSATVHLIGARIDGSLILNRAQLSDAQLALSGTRLSVGVDILAQGGFTCHGELRLNDAEIGGALRWEGAALRNPGGKALFAPDIKVGAVANLCDGFSVDGAVRMSYAQIRSRLCFDGAWLAGDAQPLIDLRHLEARELVLLPTGPIDGEVDLRNARLGVLRDDPATWPKRLRLTGASYEILSGTHLGAGRLPWLRRDPDGYQPQAYEQLAAVYRRAGHEPDARAVALANQRHRRSTLGLLGRLWGHAQDLLIGYGYRPRRAVLALALLATVGTVAFALHPPVAAVPAEAPVFNPFVYTADLLMPLIDFGQEQAFHPRPPLTWLAYALILSGWILATTVAAAATRLLRRD